MKREQIAKNIVGDLKELAALTSDIDGAQRIAWTPTFKKATEWFAKKMQAAGAEVWTAGQNLLAKARSALLSAAISIPYQTEAGWTVL